MSLAQARHGNCSLPVRIFDKIMKIRTAILTGLAALLCIAAYGQSRTFETGKWIDIHNALLKALSASYVDSLPLSRIEMKGIEAMLGDLDPYTEFVPEEEQEDFQMMINKTYGGVGAIIFKPEKDGNVIINEPYSGAPVTKAGIVAGDEIMEIDGVSVKGLDSKQCSDRMKGKPGTVVKFKIKKVRSGEIKDVEVTRERIHLPDVEYAGMLEDGTTGYMLQSGFTEGVSDAVRSGFLKLREQGMKKFVLDLRGNGGGIMQEAVKIVSLFVPKGSVVVSSKGNNEKEMVYRTVGEPVDTEMPIVILVDSGSASSSEIVAGAMQDLDRATILGRRTFGKGLVQSIRPLPYNGQLKVTTAKYYTPSGRCVQVMDYSRRNEDGSVGAIPDSLTKGFKTLHGRTVRDGGGITPDDTLKVKRYSRLTYSLVLNAVTEQYALEYVRSHESIPAPEDFRLSDKEYEDFVAFAENKEFDYRSSAQAYFDLMKKELAEDGLDESMKPQIEALENAIKMDKRTFLNLKKDEIVPFLEEEIVIRYYYQQAGVKVRLRYDDQLREALTKPLISF